MSGPKDLNPALWWVCPAKPQCARGRFSLPKLLRLETFTCFRLEELCSKNVSRHTATSYSDSRLTRAPFTFQLICLRSPAEAGLLLPDLFSIQPRKAGTWASREPLQLQLCSARPFFSLLGGFWQSHVDGHPLHHDILDDIKTLQGNVTSLIPSAEYISTTQA